MEANQLNLIPSEFSRKEDCAICFDEKRESNYTCTLEACLRYHKWVEKVNFGPNKGKCKICGKSRKHLKDIYKHLREKHPQQIGLEQDFVPFPKFQTEKMGMLLCPALSIL